MVVKKFPLFRLMDFKVYLDISWFVIAILLIWTLGGALFPVQYPGLGTGVYVLMAIAATLALFASIVFHEFAHAVVARRFGMPMRGITLFIFGGIAEMEEEPQSPRQEFWMAIAGPVMSLLIAGVFYLVHQAVVTLQYPLAVIGVVDYVWKINIILVIFNMIPAFPLDGGRILRSILWGIGGKLKRATKISANIGSAFGFFLMFIGAFGFFTGNLIGGLWYFLIGMFIRFAAKSAYGEVQLKTVLRDKTIGQFIHDNPAQVPSSLTLRELVDEYFYRRHYRMLPVVDNGELRGVITTEECSKVPKEQWDYRRVGDHLRHDYPLLTSKDSAYRALRTLMNKDKMPVPVVDHDDHRKLVGIMTSQDIIEYLALELELNKMNPNKEDLEDILGRDGISHDRRKAG